ncbi:MAG: hypothetical protein H6697_11780 [Myxococcales bacterium]|nr:hypothetical protein [Myxococcales bacterium]
MHPVARPSLLRLVAPAALIASLVAPVSAGEVFSKPPLAGGGLNAASYVTPDGSDSDFWSWDDFTLAETQTITEVRWRGGYAQTFGTQPHVVDFRVSFFESIAGGSQPVVVALPEHEDQEIVIATFHTNNAANETVAGTSGGKTVYDYRFVLPAPVTLQGGVKYWFRVCGAQPGSFPDWGMSTSSPGSHFAYNQGAHMFQNWPNELSFSLHARWENAGLGLAGTAGTPSLTGSGTLAGNSNCAFTLASARPSAPAWIVIGFTDISAPFKGGTLVPDPVLVLAAATDASGGMLLPFVMPAGVPAGVDILTQIWVSDPAGPVGFAASNGLVATTP